VVIGTIRAAVLVVQAVALAAIVDDVFLGGAGTADVAGLLVLLMAAFTVRALLAWIEEILAHRSAAAAKSELRRRLVGRVLGGERTADGRGALVASAVQGIEALDRYFARYLAQIVLAALAPLLIIIWVLPTDWLSAVIFFVTVPLIPVFMWLIGQYAAQRTRRQWDALHHMSARFLDSLRGLATLRIFGRAADRIAVVADASADFRRATMGTLRIAFLSAFVLELVATISTALVAVAIGIRVVDAGLDFRPALAILVLAPEVYAPLRRLGTEFHAAADGIAAAATIFDELDRPPAVAAGRVAAPPVVRGVEFVDVTFGFPEQPVLSGATFSITAGERVAFTGPSGAGKSTILGLLLRFVHPGTGRILVDGVDLATVDPVAWRRRIAWVGQDPHLFYGTVADNLRLGNPEASAAALERAAEAAGAHGFIAALPRGYDTMVGERGILLSAGQRRRLALARALLREAPLLLLDEPTANLDLETEEAVRAALATAARGRTVLVVAHRPALAGDADRVLSVGNGTVREVPR
jgi:thiol reductant ABC exporter CydD subunit